MTVAGDTYVLLPPGNAVTPLAENARRPADIVYAYIKATLDFSDLVTPTHCPYTLPLQFFIQLPQTIYDVQNGATVVVPITTYDRPSDIRTLTAALLKSTIFDVTHQSAPYHLEDPSFSRTSAIVESTKPDVDTRDRVLELT